MNMQCLHYCIVHFNDVHTCVPHYVHISLVTQPLISMTTRLLKGQDVHSCVTIIRDFNCMLFNEQSLFCQSNY